MEEIDNWWEEEEEENNEEEEDETSNEEEIEERIRREYEQGIKELEEKNEKLKENQNEEDPYPIQDMKIIIQDLLKEVKPLRGDLSEEEEDIYTDIRRGMREDQDEETMRGYEEELRKTLNKLEEMINSIQITKSSKRSRFPKMSRI